jgi:hypothetical protein
MQLKIKLYFWKKDIFYFYGTKLTYLIPVTILNIKLQKVKLKKKIQGLKLYFKCVCQTKFSVFVF